MKNNDSKIIIFSEWVTMLQLITNGSIEMKIASGLGLKQDLNFLSGLFKMATGKDSGFEGKKMEYDEETGEVVMRFKMPDMKD